MSATTHARPKQRPKQRAKARRVGKYIADPLALYRAVNRTKPFDQLEQMQLNLPPRVAFESLKKGHGEESDFHVLAAVANVVLVCAERISPALVDTATAACQALMRTRQRHQRTGIWSLDGPAFTALPQCIELHEQLLANQTPVQMQQAMNEVLRRMRGGDVLE